MSACNGFGMPEFGPLSMAPSVTLLPVQLWGLYDDVHEIFEGDGVRRLVIGENPFGADYGYMVLLRTDTWQVGEKQASGYVAEPYFLKYTLS
jgi:hypothetical protein